MGMGVSPAVTFLLCCVAICNAAPFVFLNLPEGSQRAFSAETAQWGPAAVVNNETIVISSLEELQERQIPILQFNPATTTEIVLIILTFKVGHSQKFIGLTRHGKL